MAMRVKERAEAVDIPRSEKPINPSVWGTAKQSLRTRKSGNVGSGRRTEGRGHPPGGGRGGKVVRRKR